METDTDSTLDRRATDDDINDLFGVPRTSDHMVQLLERSARPDHHEPKQVAKGDRPSHPNH